MKVLDSSQLSFFKSDRQLLHESLKNLNDDLLNSNAYLVGIIKEEIELVKEDLKSIRSFFGNVEQELYKDMWTCVLNVAYESKDVMSSILVKDDDLLHLIY